VTPLNVLIVDDERLARNELRRLLAVQADVAIAGEAANAADAEALLRAGGIDVLFLDIQMPGGSGFDLLERLDTVPAVIFTTAFDEYAVRAFEVSALDYLLKPIRPERLAAALAKVREIRGRRSGRLVSACSFATASAAGLSLSPTSCSSRPRATTRARSLGRSGR